MKKQRQQAQYGLLAWRQAFHRTGQSALIDAQKAPTQLSEHLPVDAFIQIGTNFLGARHIKLKPAR